MIKNNYFYNNKYGIFLFIIIFLIYILWIRYFCNCNKIGNYCYRKESFGIQLNHIILFIFFGLFFPSYFYTLIFLGILWEFFEYLIHINPFLFKLLQGCMISNNNKNNKKNIYFYNVYKDEDKYMNIIDKVFNIQNSKTHLWHHSLAEIFINILSFIIGKLINNYYL